MNSFVHIQFFGTKSQLTIITVANHDKVHITTLFNYFSQSDNSISDSFEWANVCYYYTKNSVRVMFSEQKNFSGNQGFVSACLVSIVDYADYILRDPLSFRNHVPYRFTVGNHGRHHAP